MKAAIYAGFAEFAAIFTKLLDYKANSQIPYFSV